MYQLEEAADGGVTDWRGQVSHGPFGGIDAKQVMKLVPVLGASIPAGACPPGSRAHPRPDTPACRTEPRPQRTRSTAPARGRAGGTRRPGQLPSGWTSAGRLAKLTWKLARTARSPALISSSRRCSSRSRLAMAPMVQPLRVARRAAQILMASGSPAQARSSSAVASGSAVARSSPTILVNNAQRLVIVEHVEVDQLGAGQVGHPAAGRDQHRAGRGAGQQRPDLGGVTGVVEHDEHPAPGQDGPVAGRALVLVEPGCPGRRRRGRAGTWPARPRRGSGCGVAPSRST